MAASEEINSAAFYRLLRSGLGPWCKANGMKRLKGTQGWYGPIENGYFMIYPSLGGSGWDWYMGSRFRIHFAVDEHFEGQLVGRNESRLRVDLSELLSAAELEQVRAMQDDVIARSDLPPSDHWYYGDDEIMSWYQKAQEPVTSAYQPGDSIELRYIEVADVERWCEFLVERLPAMRERLSARWQQVNPDAVQQPVKREAPEYQPWQEIIDAPEEDEPRLIYADWLEERGDPRGEFIRVQCQMAATDETDPNWKSLDMRNRRFLSEYSRLWTAEFDKLPVSRFSFRRGFVDGITITANQFIKSADKVFAALPLVRRVQFKQATDLENLALQPGLSLLEGVSFTESHLPDEGAWKTFLNSDNWQALKEFDLSGMRFAPSRWEALLASPLLDRLTSLDLRGTQTSADKIAQLAACGRLANLQSLSLHFNRVNSASTTALANCQHLTNLESLNLKDNTIGGKGLIALAKSPYLGKLRTLRVTNNRITSKGIQALLEATNLPALKIVHVWDVGVNDDDMAKLRERYTAIDTSY